MTHMGLFDSIDTFIVMQKSGNIGYINQPNEMIDLNCSQQVATPKEDEKYKDENHKNSCSLCPFFSSASCSHPPQGTPQSRSMPDFAALLEADLSDLEAGLCLPAALFLHAVSLVKSTADAGFESMCKRFVPYWRKRLDPEAWTVLATQIRPRLADLKVQNSNGRTKANV